MVNQDNVAPPARDDELWKQHEQSRKTELIGIRLSPEDALALKLQAKANARSVSAHIARLVQTAGDPIASRMTEDRVADASQLAAAIQYIPHELHDLRLRMNSLGGLIKSLFIRPESVAHANHHGDECAELLSALLRAADATVPICSRIEEEFSEVKSQLEAIVLRLARD